MKPAPKYWWDFDHDNQMIVVQSDYKGGERLASFIYTCNAELQIAQAEKLISDYSSGRVNPPFKKQRNLMQ